jgi:L-ascorbate metabolism protein UlaG (beta-lactamase superfamily)
MSITITWIGHSAFSLEIGGQTVLIDPFIGDNPLAAAQPEDFDPAVILLSHAHGDHLGDTVAIAKRTGAVVVANFEIGNWMMANGVENVEQVNPGGTYGGDFLDAKWTVAHHSSSFPDGTYGGQPNGIIITANGLKLYFAGDTSLFSDMKLIGEEGIDLAFLPIGDKFTMGIDDSIKAVKFIEPRVVLPMHYNTFPPIAQDASAWAERVNKETDATPIVLDPGGSYVLD